MNNFNSMHTFVAIGCFRYGAGMSINNIIMLLKYGTFGARAQIALDQFLEVDAIMKYFVCVSQLMCCLMPVVWLAMFNTSFTFFSVLHYCIRFYKKLPRSLVVMLLN